MHVFCDAEVIYRRKYRQKSLLKMFPAETSQGHETNRRPEPGERGSASLMHTIEALIRLLNGSLGTIGEVAPSFTPPTRRPFRRRRPRISRQLLCSRLLHGAAWRHVDCMWSRRIWMKLAAFSGGGSVLGLIFGSDVVHGIAQIQFAHAMATLACATVMNIGGRQARWAPGFFLSGAAIFCGSGYAVAANAPSWIGALQWPGAALLLTGWGILSWAAGSVDRSEQAPSRLQKKLHSAFPIASVLQRRTAPERVPSCDPRDVSKAQNLDGHFC